jgi:hypothetical protein
MDHLTHGVGDRGGLPGLQAPAEVTARKAFKTDAQTGMA